jgi:leucyl-tRNA synthetase
MFGFRWDQGGPWDSHGILGVERFLEKAWDVVVNSSAGNSAPTPAQVRDLKRKQHQAIRRITTDIEGFSFNTMVAGLMEYTNALVDSRSKAPALVSTADWTEAIQTLALLLAPGFPHIAEEMWERIGGAYSVHQQSWPVWDEALAKEDVVEIAVQVNGKVRDKLTLPVDIEAEAAKTKALAVDGVKKHVEGKKVVKVIYVPGRLVNIVVK